MALLRFDDLERIDRASPFIVACAPSHKAASTDPNVETINTQLYIKLYLLVTRTQDALNLQVYKTPTEEDHTKV